jgi:hypothetical protein
MVIGFDVTGVTTEIDLTFPEIKNELEFTLAFAQQPAPWF